MPYKIRYSPVASGKDWAKVDVHGHVVSRHRSKEMARKAIAAYYANRKKPTHNQLLFNVRKAPRKITALKMDPTRTTLLRNKFVAETRRHFSRLRSAVLNFMVVQDALGLNKTKLSLNASHGQYSFLTDDKKLQAFNEWFQEQVKNDILIPSSGTPDWQAPPGSIAAGPWTNKYVDSAYRRGLLNAYLASKKQDIAGGKIPDNSSQFLMDSFSSPTAISKVQLLATRAWENMKGVTDTMGTQMNMILAGGLIDGSSAEDIAQEMVGSIDGLTDARALTIARTEIIHAHAEGQLDSFAQLGVEELGVQAEWSTAGDDNVCPECADMEGQLFNVDEARGLIPLHPNCRCSWIPYVPNE